MWASHYIIALREGQTVTFRPRGNSMDPVVKDNQEVIVAPLNEEDALRQGDVVLCTVNGRQYLHLVRAVEARRVLIGSMRGLNGWTPRKNVYGILIAKEK